MYSIGTNQLLDVLSVNESPAILEISPSSKSLFVSRMMIMSMEGAEMGSLANIVDEISYGIEGMSLNQSYDTGIPTPHGIEVTNSSIITASNTTDFLSKISLLTGDVTTVSLDSNINTIPSLEINRLNPLEIEDIFNYFISELKSFGFQKLNNSNRWITITELALFKTAHDTNMVSKYQHIVTYKKITM